MVIKIQLYETGQPSVPLESRPICLRYALLTILLLFSQSLQGAPSGAAPLTVDGTVGAAVGDSPGITVSPISGNTTEAGGTATFTIELDSEPTADVAIGISSSDEFEATVSPTTLTFTSVDWSTPQTVTVTGVSDNIDDGDLSYTVIIAPATSSDPDYNGIDPPDISMLNIDIDTAGISVSTISNNTSEAGVTATFTVVLNSEPADDVVVGLSSDDTTEGTISSAALTFTPSNWATPQTVTVTGVDDALADGNSTYHIVTAPGASSDGNYNGMDPADVTVVNVDNDTAGFTIYPLTGTVSEGGTSASFDMVLNSPPTADVTIALTSNDTTEGTVSPSFLIFTPGNWDTPKTFIVTGVDDDIDDDDVSFSVVTTPAESGDSNYDGIDPDDVTVTNSDNDAAEITIYLIGGAVSEGSTSATFGVVLGTVPTADVVISLASDNTAEGTVSPSAITLTSETWATPQVFTVTGVDDNIDDGDTDFTIVTGAAVSSDVNYDGINPDDISLSNADDDTAGVSVSAISSNTTEAGGAATFTVVLDSEPLANVSIGLSSSATSEASVSPPLLTFTPANWGTPQTVTVTGVDDSTDDGDVAYSIITDPAVSSDTNYNGVNPTDVTIINTDNDTAGFTVSSISGRTSEDGTAATFTVNLNSKPIADVTISITSSDTTEGTVSPSSVTFTTSIWDTPQTVTVSGINDEVQDGHISYQIITAPATSSDANYNGLNPDDVTVTNSDDDIGEILISAVEGSVTEGGTSRTFSVVLGVVPSADVMMSLTSDDTTEGTVSPSTITFSSSTWATPQIFTVTGVDDHVDDGDMDFTIVTSAVVSSDTKYDGIDPDDFILTNTDDDTAGITVSEISSNTTEAGGAATLSIVLDSEPLVDVSIGLSISETNEATVSPSSLNFTAADWSTPQTVTVTGVDDNVDDGHVAYFIIIAASFSFDANYNGIDPADVAISNIDDDTAGITVSTISGRTSEDGTTATFTIILDSEPVADVTATISSSDTTEGTVSPSGLTFTASTWDDPQTITVTGVNDDLLDGYISFQIITAPATSSDANYHGLDIPDISVVNKDNDTDPVLIVVEKARITIPEGYSETCSVKLNSQPLASVTVQAILSGDSDLSISGFSTLTFTTTNWNDYRQLTLTAADDDDYTNGSSTLTLSSEKADPATVELLEADNDTPGLGAGSYTGNGGWFSCAMGVDPAGWLPSLAVIVFLLLQRIRREAEHDKGTDGRSLTTFAGKADGDNPKI